MAEELDATGASATVGEAHAAYDHTDHRWDDRVLAELEAVDRELAGICDQLTGVQSRFDGHAQRHNAALEKVRRGQHAWLDAPDRASCQLVWIQLQ